jgi:hypothetical protein
MEYGCGLCNNNHRIILCMIITFEQNIFEKLPFEELAIRAIDFRAADFEQFVFEQLHSRNLPRFRINGRGGGVCIYVNENLIKKNKFQTTVLDISVEPYDTLWIKFSSNLFSFVTACVYRPPLNASSNSIENDRKLINVIEDQFKNLSNLIIVGDFNYPNIKWKADCYSSSSFSDSLFTDMLNDNNISQAVSDFTRFRHNQKSSLLDLVLISDCNLISNLSISDPIGLSDHCTIEIDLQVILYSKCNIESFVYKFTDNASLSKCLDLTDWSILYNSADVEEQ